MRLDPTLAAYVGLTLLALAALTEWADPAPHAGAHCAVGHVYDGDTVEVICPEGRRTARLIGLDTPELKGRCPAETAAAEAAKRTLAGLVRMASVVSVTIKGQDKYGRDLIVLGLDGRDAADAMLAMGHGRPYDGGHRDGWCP